MTRDTEYPYYGKRLSVELGSTVFPRIIAGAIIPFSHQRGVIILVKALIRGRQLFQILLTGIRELNIFFHYPVKSKSYHNK